MHEIVTIFFGAGLFINAILFIPQILALYKAKTAEDFSLITFIGFNIIQLSFALHGFAIHDYILAVGYLFSLFTCGSVTILIFLYKRNNLLWSK